MKTMAMDVEVMDIRKSIGNGNIKANATVRFGGCLTVKGVKVVTGKNGLFVSLPSNPGKDGRWFNLVEVADDLKNELERKVLSSFDKETDGVRS